MDSKNKIAAFTAERNQSDQKTDREVEVERSDVDDKISKSRLQSDATRDEGRKIAGGPVSGEQQLGDDRLSHERRQSDEALKIARFDADAAIDSVRAQNTLDRQQTDQTLEDELASHLRTKVKMTSRDEFLAIVSHDLRNPIGAVSTCAEMLLDVSNEKKMDPKIRHWIQFMKRNADSAIRLISDLLDMERIAEGKLLVQLHTHCMGDVIRESVESFVHIAATRSILLRSIPSDFTHHIVFDRDRIMQVLSNLLGNALKFSPEGTSIIVSASLTPRTLRVAIIDNGPGIAAEKKEQIFTRFAQLGSKDRRGLGLGLYISKMLIEAHHGTIGVESVEGQGSTFYFEIPRILDHRL